MLKWTVLSVLASAAIVSALSAWTPDARATEEDGVNGEWRSEFGISECTLSTTGRNRYFRLEPGYQIVIESDDAKVQITVLERTKMVDGIETRVVEEREWEDGELYEVAMNYFAICEQTGDVFYFGEDVDFYEDGEMVDHEGAWLVGENDAKAGLIMSGSPRLGMKYYQEIAPGVAMDRGEIVELDGVCETPAGTFSDCMRIKEGTALNPFETEYKYYAPDIGLIQDEDLVLTSFGFVDD